MLRLHIKRVKFDCTYSILLMSFFEQGGKIWLLYSRSGRTYILNNFVRTVAELVLEQFDICKMNYVQLYINSLNVQFILSFLRHVFLNL